MARMFLFFCLLTVCASSVNLVEYTFKNYVEEYRKGYSGSEYIERKAIFQARLRDIIQHNANPRKRYTRGVNHMLDWTTQEFSALRGYKKQMGALNKQRYSGPTYKELYSIIADPLPKSVDWRDHNVVTPVKNQGHCGSCWAFAAAETIESHWAIKTGSLQILSPQQLAFCTDNPLHCGGKGGCEGGIAQLAFDGVTTAGGIATEWSYPYVAWFGRDDPCQFNTSMDLGARVEHHLNLPSNEYIDLMSAVANLGPVSVVVDASLWKDYESGVYDGCNMENPDIDHAVQLVGYGTDETHGEYWLVRNSWGTSWGENGYIRLARNTGLCGNDTFPEDGSGCDGNRPDSFIACGMCGILYDTTVPIVNPTMQ